MAVRLNLVMAEEKKRKTNIYVCKNWTELECVGRNFLIKEYLFFFKV